MNGETIDVLLVEDNPQEAEIVRLYLAKKYTHNYNIRHSDSAVLQGSTEVTLNEQGKAFYSITVESTKKLKEGFK